MFFLRRWLVNTERMCTLIPGLDSTGPAANAGELDEPALAANPGGI